MKKLLAVSFLASTLAMAHAAEYAPQEFDFSELGTVQSVRQVQVMDLLPNVLEHAVRPETVNELVVRSDDGREVTLRDEAMQRFVAGERVRLEPSNRGPRVEHDYSVAVVMARLSHETVGTYAVATLQIVVTAEA